MHHICLAFQDSSGKYYTYAATTLLSVCEHSSEPVSVHILHDQTLVAAHQEHLRRLAAALATDIEFHDVENLLTGAADPALAARYGQGSLYRYAIPRILPAARVLYLDCDIIALTDVAALFAHAALHAPFCLAAVADRGASYVSAMRAHVRTLGLESEKYFNSGVLLWDTATINTSLPDCLQACLKISARQSGSPFVDQDSLNVLFAKLPKLWLPEQYNTFMDFLPYMLLEEEQLQGRILHFTGNKPWQDTRFAASAVFLRYHHRARLLMRLEA